MSLSFYHWKCVCVPLHEIVRAHFMAHVHACFVSNNKSWLNPVSNSFHLDLQRVNEKASERPRARDGLLLGCIICLTLATRTF